MRANNQLMHTVVAQNIGACIQCVHGDNPMQWNWHWSVIIFFYLSITRAFQDGWGVLTYEHSYTKTCAVNVKSSSCNNFNKGHSLSLALTSSVRRRNTEEMVTRQRGIHHSISVVILRIYVTNEIKVTATLVFKIISGQFSPFGFCRNKE